MTAVTFIAQVLLGLVYGSVISYFNHRLLVNGWDKVNPRSVAAKLDKLKRNIMVRYGIHFLIDVLALLLVAKWHPVLISTAVAIVIMQKVLIVKYIKTDKEVKN